VASTYRFGQTTVVAMKPKLQFRNFPSNVIATKHGPKGKKAPAMRSILRLPDKVCPRFISRKRGRLMLIQNAMTGTWTFLASILVWKILIILSKNKPSRLDFLQSWSSMSLVKTCMVWTSCMYLLQGFHYYKWLTGRSIHLHQVATISMPKVS